jgi:putative membrane protein
MSLFTKAESDRIASLIAAAERRTAGEIVVAEVARSDAYPEVRLFATLLVALLAASLAHVIWPGLHVGAVLAVQFAAGLLTFFVSGAEPLLRGLVPRGRAELAVGRAAELAFLEHAVFATRDRTGVLIFLSRLEHRVVILGDEGIHARLQNPGWEQLVATLVRAIKQGKAGEGVCEVIERLGEHLARDAPQREGDTNELDNRVRSS